MKSYLRHSKDLRCQGSGLAVPLQVCVLWPPGEKYLHTSRAVEEGKNGNKKKKGENVSIFFFFGGGMDESFLSSVQDGVETIISFLFFFFHVHVGGCTATSHAICFYLPYQSVKKKNCACGVCVCGNAAAELHS